MSRLPYLFFFLSGASSLVLEVAWVRQFSLVLGNTVLSTTVVLAAFMGGLALGSYLAGRFARRVRRPLRAYGVLEGAIGIYALVLPLLIRGGEPLLRGVYDDLLDRGAALAAVRFLIALVLLAVPTTLMGATLPLLSQALTRRREEAGSVSGRLYAANLIGAATGSFLGGFVLLPGMGLLATVVLAAAVNFGITGAVWLNYRDTTAPDPHAPAGKGKKPRPSEREDRALSTPPPGAPEPLDGAARLAVFLFALSGVASMIYQVTWVRLLSLIFGSSVYSFGLTVTVFIVGLGVGDWVLSSRRIRYRNDVWLLGAVLAAVGVTTLVTLPLVQHLPERTFETVSGGASFGALLRFQVLWTFALLFLPTFFIGSVFPVVIRIVSRSRASAGGAVGLAYSWNTVGAIVGTLVGGLVLVPRLGIQDAMIVAVCLSFLGAAVGAALSGAKAGPRLGLAGGAALAAAAVWILPAPLAATALSSGPYHPATGGLLGPRAGWSDFVAGKTFDLVFHEEGMAATVSVRRDHQGSLALVIGGKVDASISADGGDLPTQIMLSALPLLLKGDAENLLVVGLASGMSVGAAEAFPLASIDCVEISPEVVRACREHFNVHNGRALDDPRLRMILTDARHHITMTGKRYDVIVSEPSNPWIAGINALFTRDFFEAARERLAPGGLFCQWFHAYDMSERGVKVILRTFAEVFPHVTLWESLSGDYFLVGSGTPITLDPAAWERLAAANPGLREWLRRAGIGDVQGLFGNLMAHGEYMRPTVGEGPVNTDDNGFLEYHAPYDMYAHTRFPTAFFTKLRMPDPAPLYAASAPAEAIRNAAAARLEAYRARTQAESNLVDAAGQSYENAFRLGPHDPLVRAQRAQYLVAKSNAQVRSGDAPGALVALEALAAAPPLHAEDYYLGWAHVGRASAFNMLGRSDEALAALDLAAVYTPGNGRMWVLRGMVLQQLGRSEDALAALRTAEEEHGIREIEMYLTRAAIHAGIGMPDNARRDLAAAEALYPGDPRIASLRSQLR